VDEETHLLSQLEDKALSLMAIDKWVCKLDESSGYSVSSANNRLRLAEDGTFGSIYDYCLESLD